MLSPRREHGKALGAPYKAGRQPAWVPSRPRLFAAGRLSGRDNRPRSWLSFVAMRPVSLAAQPNCRSNSALMERRRHQTCRA